MSSGGISQLKVSASDGGSSVANWLSSKPGGMKWPRRDFIRSSSTARGPVR